MNLWVELRLNLGAESRVKGVAAENEFEAKLGAAEFPADIYEVARPCAGAPDGCSGSDFTEHRNTDRHRGAEGGVAADDSNAEFA